ncbi:unnamed protein product [Closterium sp. NIES-54]
MPRTRRQRRERQQGRSRSIDESSPPSICKAAQGEADVEEDVVYEGRRQLQRQGPRRWGGVVLDDRHGGTDNLASAGGWRGLPGCGGCYASQRDGGVARQQLLPPPDGDEGGLRRHGAESRCEVRAWIQQGTAVCRGALNRCSARGGREAGPHPRRALRFGCTCEPAICWPAEGERSAAAGRWRRDAATWEVLGRARYTGRVLCTDLHPCSTRSPSTEEVALRTIVSATKLTPDRLHSRLAHIGVDTIKSSTKHEVATGLDIKPWEFLGKEFTNFVNGKGIVHDLTCPYTPQQDGMAEREMRTVVESVRTMLLHMGVQHHWWHLTLRQAIWRGGKMAPKTRWGLHLGVSPESKSWEVLDLTDNKVVTLVKVIFYETLSLEVWKVNYGSALGRTQAHLPTNTMTATIPLLTEVDEPADEDVVEVLPPPPVLAPPTPVADRPALTPVSATSDEGSLEASPGAPASGIPVKGSNQLVDDEDVDEEGELSAGEESTDNDVVEVLVEKPELRRTGRTRKPPERLVFHACLPPAAFTTVYDDAKEDVNLPELDPDVHADPEHHWDIARMTVKEALASWKGEAVKAAMEEEICSLVGMGTWELVERPHGVNIMKNQRVLTTKYRMDDTVEREKARLVMKGFTQVYGADYDETYSPVSSYVTLRIFLNIVAVLDLNLMQLDMKNAFLQSKLERKSQVDTALYFKAGDVGVTCWVLVYVNDLLAASSNTAMLKELKELLEAAFELCEMSPVDKYLGLEIVRDRPSRKLWLHQQNYADKLRRRFIDEEQTGRIPKMLFSVDAYAELTFDDEEAQEREEEEYGQNVGSLQFAATTTRPDIAFACSKLGSGLTLRSDQHCREVDHCLTYLADTRDTALEFGGGPESLGLIGYVDTDDVGDKQNRTSTGGYVFIFGGAAVSWSNQRIKCTTLSSTEPEYVAAIDAGKEGRRLRFLLAEFKMLDVGKPTILRVDNKSAITVAEGLGLTGNLKHMEELYAWLQHMARHGKFMLKYIPTTEQPADFLT